MKTNLSEKDMIRLLSKAKTLQTLQTMHGKMQGHSTANPFSFCRSRK
jgi:hypothetical protein